MTIEDPQWRRADQWLLAGQGREAAELDMALVGVPSSIASLTPSLARTTPYALRRMLGSLAAFDGERGHDLDSIVGADLGDLDVGGDEAMDLSQRAIEASAARLVGNGVRAYIGGDNAITRPLVRAEAAGDLSSMAVLTIDAHHDVRHLEAGPTNGSPIRGLIEDGLSGGNVVQLGIGAFANSGDYRRYCDDQGIRFVTVPQLRERGILQTVAWALELLSSHAGRVYVDFDLDVLDRSYAPACPGARPGGLTPRELFDIAFLCGRYPAVVAADFVEVDADRDIGDATLLTLGTAVLSFASGLVGRKQGAP